MEKETQNQVIVSKLKKGQKFGLYEGALYCYFDDGTRVHYHELWEAVRILNNLEPGHKMTLLSLCPHTFRGIFPHKFRKYNWLKKQA